VEDAISVTPTIIKRVRHAERALEVVSVPEQETGERALLVFMDEDQAEAFRTDTGRYPASEGFEVGAVDVEGLAAICAVWGFGRVGLRGPEPEAVSFMDAEEFCEMLEPGETVAEVGLPER
jgi:hypothetical protein